MAKKESVESVKFRSPYKKHVVVMPTGTDAKGNPRTKRLAFIDGVYATSDPDEIAFIRGLRDYGAVISEEKRAEEPPKE